MNIKLGGYIMIIICLMCSCWFLSSCKEEAAKVNEHKSEEALKVVRFETELFALDTLNIEQSLDELKTKHPNFYKLYFANVLPLTEDSAALSGAVKSFITDKAMIRLKDTSLLVAGNFDQITKQLDDAFGLIQKYFPQYKKPVIYTFVSEYSFQNFIFDDGGRDGVGIGLDMFLAPGFDYKKLDPQNPNFSDYLTRTFNKDHIVSKTIQTIIDDLVGESPGNTLMDYMVHNGKKLYLKKLFLPEAEDTLIFEYSKGQMEWVKENELEMWSFFLDKNLMYESTFSKINKYINPSPNSPGMPSEAPGKTANYLGYKIVEAFVSKSSGDGLMEVLNNNDAQKILEISKYKPKR